MIFYFRSQEFTTDDFVRVKVVGQRGSSKVYVGQILSVDNDNKEVNVSFMKETKRKQEFLYYWPENKDIAWSEMSNILDKLEMPTLSECSTNRRLLYAFKDV